MAALTVNEISNTGGRIGQGTAEASVHLVINVALVSCGDDTTGGIGGLSITPGSAEMGDFGCWSLSTDHIDIFGLELGLQAHSLVIFTILAFVLVDSGVKKGRKNPVLFHNSISPGAWNGLNWRDHIDIRCLVVLELQTRCFIVRR